MDAPAQRARRLLQEVFGRFPGQLNPAFVSNQKLMAFTGFSNFQGKQQEAITAVLSGWDVFVLMPTGGGKSLCYSLPALVKSGTALIVSPLIALMENQVANLQKRNVKCNFLSSTKTAQERSSILQDIKSAAPALQLLFITPELLSTGGFMGVLKAMNSRGTLTLFAVDEAHCISSWGHDFRPAYRKLGMIRQQLPGVPIMALTATAAPQVQDDIMKQLKIPSAVKLVSSFNRPNIHYSVKVVTEAQSDPLPHIVALLKEGRRAEPDGAWPCSIIYALKKESTEEIAAGLTHKGAQSLLTPASCSFVCIPCQAYHAGRPAKERSRVLEDWNEGRVPVVAATIAFGMGIDRANVRLVVHYSLPKTLEGFYQESGRAGRDGKPARSLVFYGLSDRDRMDWILAKQKKGKGRKRKADDSEADSAAAVAAFSRVVAYCVTETCRRALVLGHFGEALPQGSCTGCDCCEQPDVVKAQLHQLDSEVLQHAQQKAERFGRRGPKASRAAHRSEGDPFADAAPSGQYDDLPSGSEDEAGEGDSTAEAAAAEQAVKRARQGGAEGASGAVFAALETAEAQHNRQQQDVSASQRLTKLLQNKGKSKQASQSSQPQPSPAITAAMRKHAADRITKALTDNSELNLETSQAESGACRWERHIFEGSNSKSAYLSKLSNAVSQIKRAPDLAQLGLPATAWVPDQATPPACPDMAERMQSTNEPSVEDARNAALLLLTSDNQHEPSSAQPMSEGKLRQMMQDLEDASGATSRTDSTDL
ncbi:MAG: ATP-dependent DNA helicase Q-like 3-like [Trebouxia sp. A1-2]|nr:MAG: ATP-dependent DNA helicase Q-like 3-like [Trebouxia sp. A1-2]